MRAHQRAAIEPALSQWSGAMQALLDALEAQFTEPLIARIISALVVSHGGLSEHEIATIVAAAEHLDSYGDPCSADARRAAAPRVGIPPHGTTSAILAVRRHLCASAVLPDVEAARGGEMSIQGRTLLIDTALARYGTRIDDIAFTMAGIMGDALASVVGIF
jgi:hypothetical protein